MKQLLNTLYVTGNQARLELRNGAVEITDGEDKYHIPLHNLESIVSFSYIPVSPALLEYCVENGIYFSAMSTKGSLKYRVEGPTHGNTELRMKQYSAHETETSLQLADRMIYGKMRNQAYVLRRHAKNHKEYSVELRNAASEIATLSECTSTAGNVDNLRGLESLAARRYFDVFGYMVRSDDSLMQFTKRSRRPPEDRCNSLLSFAYTLLSSQCTAALEETGLDPSLGVMHSVRPGRAALALDLMEELRPIMVDRFVVNAINNGIITASDFDTDDGIRLTRAGLKKFFAELTREREKEVYIPAIDEKIPMGLLPYVQAKMLRKCFLDGGAEYVPYLWEEA